MITPSEIDLDHRDEVSSPVTVEVAAHQSLGHDEADEP